MIYFGPQIGVGRHQPCLTQQFADLRRRSDRLRSGGRPRPELCRQKRCVRDLIGVRGAACRRERLRAKALGRGIVALFVEQQGEIGFDVHDLIALVGRRELQRGAQRLLVIVPGIFRHPETIGGETCILEPEHPRTRHSDVLRQLSGLPKIAERMFEVAQILIGPTEIAERPLNLHARANGLGIRGGILAQGHRLIEVAALQAHIGDRDPIRRLQQRIAGGAGETFFELLGGRSQPAGVDLHDPLAP